MKGCPAIVIVPERAAPLFAATENATVPLPLPDPPPVSEIQSAPEEAVQLQPAPAVTATLPELPPAAIEALVAPRLNVHAAACVTVNVWPAIVSVPVLLPPVFAPTVKLIDPLPVPAAVVVIAIQEAFDVAVQVHAAGPLTVTEPLAPLAAADRLELDNVKLHATAACVTVNVLPATVIVPLRAAPPFAATL